MTSLLGRDREIALAEQCWSRALSGSGSLLLLTGEPGIGKTSLAKEVAGRAAGAGMRVLAGRCWEGGGAAPYWPWVQVFRELGEEPFEALVRDEGGDSQQRRFQLFDAATRRLTARAAGGPLLLFLDDLHAADLPSLLLLLFLSRQLRTVPLFVLGTSREVEPRLSAEMSDALAKVGREGEVVSLRRLNRDDVAVWVAASEDPTRNAEEIFSLTEGNPLFVHELLRLGARAGQARTSDGIRAALDEHLRTLSAEERGVLEAGAVFGRDFGSRELAELIGHPHEAVLPHLRQGVELGVVVAIGRERFQFNHVLLRDRLYEATSPRRVRELHWRAGLVLEAHGAERATVANHLLLGAETADVERAATSALEAAVLALRRLAFEAAVELAERGLVLLGPQVSLLVCRLEMARGEGSIRCGALAAGRAHCMRAAEIAQSLGYAELQAEAALAYAAEWVGLPEIDPVMVRLLEAALAALGTGDSLLAARVTARLANALNPPTCQEQADHVERLGRAALAMGRRLGHAENLLKVLELSWQALTYSIPSDERFELTRETITLAQALDQRLTLLKLGPVYALTLLERGFRAEADAALAAMVDLHAALDYPQSRWRLPMLRAGFCFFDGRLDEAEQLADEAQALAERAGTEATQVNWAIQRVALAIARSDPASIAAHARRLLSLLPPAGPMSPRAWILAAMGRREEALRELRTSAAVQLGFPTLLMSAEACVLLGDRGSAVRIDEQIRKRSFGEAFYWSTAGCFAFGPTSRTLGDLARLMGRGDEARRQYQDSIAYCRRVGAQRFLELSLAGLARLEAECGAPALPAAAAAPEKVARPRPRELSLRRDGDVWALEGAPTTFRLKDSKGMAYLSELLAHPGRELHVLALIGLDHGAGDAGPVLDARAKAAYKQRLEELEARIAEAEGFGDSARADRAREEVEGLAAQLAQAVGLGGRDRRAASQVERARINVQRRVKDAIASISQFDPELGRYLSAAVKTGTYCSFTPV